MVDIFKKRHLWIFCLLLIFIMIMPVSFAEDMSDSNQTDSMAVEFDSPIAVDESADIQSADEKDIYVSPTGDDNSGHGTQDSPFKSLEKAISEATATNNIIYMANGTFTGNNNTLVNIKSNVNIIGSGGTVIDANGAGRLFNILSNNLNIALEDLTIKNIISSDYGGVIYLNMIGDGAASVPLSANVNFDNVKFVNCFSNRSGAVLYDAGGGVALTQAVPINNITITNCQFIECGSNSGGVIYSKGNIKVINSSFINNRYLNNQASGSAIIITGYASADITGCIFENNIADAVGHNSGAIYTASSNLRNFNINNNVFINNSNYAITGWNAVAGASINAENNWWGTNNPDFTALVNNVNVNSYATLNLTADSEIIDIYEEDGVTVAFYNSADNSKNTLIPLRNITLTATGGELDDNPSTFQGEFITSFSSETFGQYTITATVDGQEVSTEIMVRDLTDKTLTIPKYEVNYKDVTISVTVAPRSVTGNVTFTLNGKEEIIYLNEGKGNITIHNLPLAEYDNILLKYNGDDEHNKSNATISFMVYEKYPSNLTADGIVNLSDVTICADLNNPNATGNVTFTLNGNDEIIYLNGGKGNVTIHDLANRDYEVDLTYNGDANYQKSTETLAFRISNRAPTELIITPVINGDNLTVVAKINQTLASGNVTFYLNYMNHVINITNGAGILTINKLPNNIYDTTFYYNGDIDYAPSNTTEKITISVRKDCILTAEATVKNQAVTIDADINYISASGNVTFKINGEDKTINITRSKGSITLSNVPFGNYSILLTYNGDINYNPSTYTLNFEVIKYDYGKILYVSNDGNDKNNGSANAPLKTVSKAVDVANNFPVVEKIFIYNGVYTDSDMTIERSLDIEGESEENTIIDAQKGFLFEIYGLENNVSFSKITFKNGYNSNGGAIRDYGHFLNVTNCTFINNTAGDQGGAVYHYYGYANIENSIFSDNVAITGGAVYVSTYTDYTAINNCEFIENNALSGVYAGGAVYNAGNLYVNASKFTSNRAASKSESTYDISGGDGGAIYNANELLVNNSVFTSNSAYYWGGAIKAGGYTYIYDSNFTDNSAGSRGGAIHSSGSGSYSAWTTLISGCNFEYNLIGRSAYEGSTQIGGAICAESPTAVRDSTFTNNSAIDGGAVFMRSNAKYIENCSFIDNYAMNGGAIYDNRSMSLIFDSYFEGNGAVLGGAVFVSASYTVSEDSFTNLTTNTFISNSADKGGAIYSDAGYASPQELNIKYSEFINNTADEGSAISTTNRANIEYNAIICEMKSRDVVNVARECEGIVSVENNWWGVNSPNLKNIIVGITVPETYAVLDLTSSVEIITDDETATITAKLLWNDKSVQKVELIPLRDISLSASDANLTKANGILSPEFESVFSSDINGTHKVTAVVDNEKLSVYVTVNEKSDVPKENVTLEIEDVVICEGENATIEVVLPEYATGNVTLADKTSPVDNAIAVITIPGLDIGEYSFDVIYSGDDNYNGATATVNVTVNPKVKKNATITVNNAVIKEGDYASLTVTLPSDATGNVTIRDVTSKVDRGTAIVVISGLSTGNYTFDVIYSGDGNYNAAKATVNITVNPKGSSKENATIKIYAPAIDEGENATVTVTLPEDATGNVTVKGITLPLINGTATFTIPGLPSGKNTLDVSYTGDDKYNEISTKVTVTVKKDLADAIYANASTGSDEYGDGSKENPVKTIAKALSLVNDDGTIVLTGNFKGNGNTKIYLSSYTNNITFIGMDDAVIDGGHTSILFSITDGLFSFQDLTFKNAYSSGYGAAIINQAGTIIVEGCTFTDNVAQGSAGIDNTGSAMVIGCNFTNNLATLYDGAALSSNWEIYIYNSSFTGNHAYQNGGAMKNYEEGYMYIEGCEFIANEAGGSSDGSYGGSVYSWASHLEIISSNFSDNYASTKGGSVYASFGNSVGEFYCFIMGCEFENSEALIGSTLFLESVVGEVAYNAFLDAENVIYTSGRKDTIDNNWWGVNDPDWSGLLTGTIKSPSSYAVLNAVASPSNITTDSKAKIDYVFCWNGTTSSENISYIPLRAIELSSSGGKLKDVSGYLADGKFSTQFSSDESGNYEIAAKVDNEILTILISVNDEPVTPKKNTTVDIDAPGVTEGENATVTVTLPADATGNVTVGNVTVPLKDGKAVATISGLPVGNTTLPVIYSGDDNYNPLEGSVTVTVGEKQPEFIIDAPDVTKYYHGPERFVVTITDGDGNPIANESVKISVNGVTYTKTTDKNGSASLGLNLNSGNHTVTVEFNNTTVTANANILSTADGKDIVKVFRNATQYVATFKDSQGKYLSPGSLVEYNVNGVKYHKAVEENGIARLNINLAQGKYIITATNPVTGENTANNITVIARIVNNNDLTKYYKNASQYVVTLLGDDGNPVKAGEIVTFNINGVFYNRTTNASGQAKLNINLQPGDYIITAEYKQCRESNNIKVLPVLFASDLTKKYRGPEQFVARLLDGQGKPYEGQIVTFNIHGVFYNKTTDSNGEAKLNINLQAGRYIITSTFNGTNVARNVTVTD